MRSHYCTDLDIAQIGEVVEVCGWANSHRDHGGVIFIDLRDRSGLVQLVCDPADSVSAHTVASHVRDEFVLKAKGKVRARGEGLENPRLKTGKIEIVVEEFPNSCRPLKVVVEIIRLYSFVSSEASLFRAERWVVDRLPFAACSASSFCLMLILDN